MSQRFLLQHLEALARWGYPSVRLQIKEIRLPRSLVDEFINNVVTYKNITESERYDWQQVCLRGMARYKGIQLVFE